MKEFKVPKRKNSKVKKLKYRKEGKVKEFKVPKRRKIKIKNLKVLKRN